MDSTKNLVTLHEIILKYALQSYSLFGIFENYIIMKSIKSSKNESERADESNLGHTKDEWGAQEDTPKIRIIEGYDLKWNVDKENDEPN